MNRNALLGLVALGGIAAGVALTDFAASVEAAPGDIVPTTPRVDTGPVLNRVCFEAGRMEAHWVDSFGRHYEATIRNGNSDGWNYATGAKTVVSTPTGFTQARANFGITGTTIQTAITAMRTAGIIVIPGTIQ